jgi:hypothetical protein
MTVLPSLDLCAFRRFVRCSTVVTSCVCVSTTCAAGFVVVVGVGAPTVTAAAARPPSPASATPVPIIAFFDAIALPFLVWSFEVMVGSPGKGTGRLG